MKEFYIDIVRAPCTDEIATQSTSFAIAQVQQNLAWFMMEH
jgi:hypothetical protein